MNNDIVDRLRQFGDSCGLDAEAADEIERLRKQNEWLTRRIGDPMIEKLRNRIKEEK